jgi:hypothetical protein
MTVRHPLKIKIKALERLYKRFDHGNAYLILFKCIKTLPIYAFLETVTYARTMLYSLFCLTFLDFMLTL